MENIGSFTSFLSYSWIFNKRFSRKIHDSLLIPCQFYEKMWSLSKSDYKHASLYIYGGWPLIYWHFPFCLVIKNACGGN